jgi:hypothetical protein
MWKRKKTGYKSPNYFSEIVPIVKSGGMRLFFHYHLLILKKLLGYKTFKINSSNVCTTENEITIGKEYQLRSGSTLERVILEKLWFKHFFLYISVYLIDEKKSIKCSHTFLQIGYSGMWRLWDKDYYDYNEWMEFRKNIDYSALDDLPVITLP